MRQFDKAIICGGCFWGIEENFRTKPGIISTEVGYAGGQNSNTSYEDVFVRVKLVMLNVLS